MTKIDEDGDIKHIDITSSIPKNCLLYLDRANKPFVNNMILTQLYNVETKEEKWVKVEIED